MPIAAIVNRAGQWLLESGIQEPSGGVARYYRTDSHENRLVSTEITGYAISTLVYLHELHADHRYLQAARDAARFLTRTAWDAKSGLFPFEYAPDGSAEPYAYFFDCGIIIRGLLQLWRLTGEGEFLDSAAACGRAMGEHFSAGGGEYHPILRLPSLEPLERAPRWSRMPGCYQLKSALAWFELGEETGDERFVPWYEEALAFALRTHESFLPGAAGEFDVMDRLHAYGYFLEGMLPCADRRECMDALRTGIPRVASLLREIAPRFRRSDVFAQLLRMRFHADAAGALPVDRLAAAEEAGALAAFAVESRDQREHGGFYFGDKRGNRLPHVNPVSTGFGLQALVMWNEYRNGALRPSRQALI